MASHKHCAAYTFIMRFFCPESKDGCGFRAIDNSGLSLALKLRACISTQARLCLVMLEQRAGSLEGSAKTRNAFFIAER